MHKTLVILALGTSGCFTTTHLSTVGPFVRTIDAHRDGIVVQSCTVKKFEQTHHNILNWFFDLSPTEESELRQDQCFGAFTPLGPQPVAMTPARVLP